jgi:hypothetical protein
MGNESLLNMQLDKIAVKVWSSEGTPGHKAKSMRWGAPTPTGIGNPASPTTTMSPCPMLATSMEISAFNNTLRFINFANLEQAHTPLSVPV